MRFNLLSNRYRNCFCVALVLTFSVFANGFMLDNIARVEKQMQDQTNTSVCQDMVDNCSMYGRTACTQKVYEVWAKAHCAMYCGFCTPTVPLTSLCENKVHNCKEYDSGDLCTDDHYYSWVYENCRRYCKFGICNDGFINHQTASASTRSGFHLTTPVSTARLCKDQNGIDCSILNSSVNICADFQKAKTICKAYCGLCNVIDGQFCPWGTLSACDVTCGNGSQIRNRKCTCPSPADGGSDCVGDTSMTKECHLEKCPVHGHWAKWSSWGSCSVACGIGLERRDRSCSNPFPGPNGDPCFGDARDDRICFPGACAEGAWSSWTSWSKCSASCLGGLSKQTRLCNNPPPSAFGHSCVGNSEETKICNNIPCPDP